MDARDRLDRAVHGRARQPRRQRRAAEHPPRARSFDPVAGVDGQRVRAGLRRAAADRRRARRSVRPPADVHVRDRAVHPVLSRSRARGLGRPADRRQGAAGRRRRDRDAADPDPAGRGVPAGAPRCRDRDLVGDQRDRRGARAAGRRRRHPAELVALDLLDQRADRAGPGPAGRQPAGRELRHLPAIGPPRADAGLDRAVRHRLRARAVPVDGLDQPPDHRLARGRRRAA